jgi:hypothetical protein
MALTLFQKTVSNLIASHRRRSGESYVAGGAALNELIGAPRLSDDLDIFHDTAEAVHREFEQDAAVLRQAGLIVTIRRQWDTFVEATIETSNGNTILQWAFDSAFRFLPLVEHVELGLTLHPFDLAVNKVLALVGRAMPRDWIDIMECDTRVQPLGYLAWSASGKDPGLNPSFILEQAGRSARYTDLELEEVRFEGPRPSAAVLSLQWKRIHSEARAVVDLLPGDQVGKCILDGSGNLLTLDSELLKRAVATHNIRFHQGSLRGAFPRIIP